MNLLFDSKTLSKTLGLVDLPKLKDADLRHLHAEILMAIQTMDDSVCGAQEEMKRGGDSVNDEWVKRVRKKRKICVVFATQVKQLLDHNLNSTYDSVYRCCLDELLKQELGAFVFEQIREEARVKAVAAVDKKHTAEMGNG